MNIMDNKVTIDLNKIYTKSEYSKVYSVSRPTVDKRIKTKELRSLKINGAVLIVAQ
jgi:hypothetical protein